MADITMCTGEGCPNKTLCYRYCAPINEFRQSYFMEVPYHKDTDKCSEFIKDTRYKD